MADLHVTDVIIDGSQHGFQAAATHLEPVAQAVVRLDTSPTGAASLARGLAGQDTQLGGLLAAISQCLGRLAQDTAQAGQQFASTDHGLSREAAEAER